MNFTNVTNESDHDDHEETHILWVHILVAILSLVLGLTSAVSNLLLLLTLHKDPLRCFRRRATSVFIQGLATSDFLAGSFIQTTYSLTLMLQAAGHKISVLRNIVSIGSHVGTKISILTLVVLALDRLLAITVPWRYNSIVTRKRAVATNIFIWTFIATFEVTHIEPSIEKTLQDIDLHLQTTVPIVGLLIIFIATYLAFRKYARNTVFAQGDNSRTNRIHTRNLRFEKKIILTILLIMLVVLASLTPYLIVEKLAGCSDSHGHHGKEDESTSCKESPGLAIAKVFSLCLLSLSCALNPVLFAWRIPQYRQSLRMVVGVSRRGRTQGSVEALVQEVPIPSNRQLMEGVSQDEGGENALARNSHPPSNANIQVR